ncbi:lysylphosphatidylglycerol synthase transmembrane domain-containing protein [Nesterenkonia sphaerica]|uniref:Flippase-like domain-containing protein n=1 Tax=Nesterenkonia sphaerica TaxID=1804988 RepID=A0A5R9A6T5_9MICC|nr:lysylphosphatidylglycerol synthase transmembrane domain-containing protein [Nesterenkonia sphaerica]TLP74220.1 flippase-like domain-containing protein [Nesterenkonia sphaerica]
MSGCAPAGSGPDRSVPWRSLAVGALQVLVTVSLLGLIAAWWGMETFSSALRGLPWWTFLAAGALGGSGVLVQAQRWRIVARHHAIEVRFGAAVARCWQAAFLNSVLPGGLAGDALRAADDSTDASVPTRRRALARGFASMAAERLAGTAVVFSAGGIALLPYVPMAGLGCLGAALIAAGIASRWLRRLAAAEILRVVMLSVLGWMCFASLFMLCVMVLAPTTPTAVLPTSAAVALAGMSVPVGVGGWGAREMAAAWSFTLSGLSAAEGVRVAVGYGVLALVSTTPGAVIASLRLIPRLRRARLFAAGPRPQNPPQPPTVEGPT